MLLQLLYHDELYPLYSSHLVLSNVQLVYYEKMQYKANQPTDSELWLNSVKQGFFKDFQNTSEVLKRLSCNKNQSALTSFKKSLFPAEIQTSVQIDPLSTQNCTHICWVCTFPLHKDQIVHSQSHDLHLQKLFGTFIVQLPQGIIVNVKKHTEVITSSGSIKSR